MAAVGAEARGDPVNTRVFISYSRKDMAFADRLEAALKARGFEPLIDREEIYAFEDWWKRVEALIGRADTVVFVLSPDAVKSDVALKEVAYAASLNKRFAPIVCRRVVDDAVPEPLRRLNFIFFDDPERFDASADQLAQALHTDIAWVRRHTEFGEAARHWIEGGRARGLLLRPPVLDQAEAWIAYRPHGAPSPTVETETFIRASRQAEMAARRRSRILNAALYTMLTGIILGLVGWINQDYLKAQWRWYAVTRPYAAAQLWPYVLSAAKEQALKPLESFKECAKDCAEMVVIPAGKFLMGAAVDEKAAFVTELPQHEVVFAAPFAVSKFDLTFDDWDACAAYGNCDPLISDSGWGRGRQPVINVTWEDAQRYVTWFSQMTGKPYRLLSEAEWEYAARAGTTTAYPWGNEIGKGNANCTGCGSKWDARQTAPVGSFKPNAFGLYDMHGNVWQWVEDCYHNSYKGAPADGSAWTTGDCGSRTVRGGGWGNSPQYVRSADRNGSSTANRLDILGIRVARALTP